MMKNEDCPFDGIQKVDGNISPEEFRKEFLVKNKPVLIRGMCKDWKACKDWISHENGGINFERLVDNFGDCELPVEITQGEERKSIKMKGLDFFSKWKERSLDRTYYLKDWHFVQEFPNYNAYSCPEHFQDDWLNYYCDYKKDDDYRFVYMGPKGSWTTLHHDVLSSHSWSANIFGKKKWILFPPSETAKLTSQKSGRLLHDAREESIAKASKLEWPFVATINRFEVIQEMGDIIFVPSGWHHQVHNLTDAISINHNWFDTHAAPRIWKFLKKEMELVKLEIEHCRNSFVTEEEWQSHCQLLLKSNSGLNFRDWIELLEVNLLKGQEKNEERVVETCERLIEKLI
eukprot:g3752.t1